MLFQAFRSFGFELISLFLHLFSRLEYTGPIFLLIIFLSFIPPKSLWRTFAFLPFLIITMVSQQWDLCYPSYLTLSDNYFFTFTLVELWWQLTYWSFNYLFILVNSALFNLLCYIVSFSLIDKIFYKTYYKLFYKVSLLFYCLLLNLCNLVNVLEPFS
jgi:hypothetical protein